MKPGDMFNKMQSKKKISGKKIKIAIKKGGKEGKKKMKKGKKMC